MDGDAGGVSSLKGQVDFRRCSLPLKRLVFLHSVWSLPEAWILRDSRLIWMLVEKTAVTEAMRGGSALSRGCTGKQTPHLWFSLTTSQMGS